MPAFGFHASHEQVHPSELLAAVQRAEEAGFDAAMCSDHLAPWSERQGHSGYAWSWLGAALQATSLPFGVVTAPGQRYHPVVAAQAIATLAEMFPGRFWSALVSGEAVNGLVTVDRARLWDLPTEPPMLVGAAVSEATARTVGGWADALVTINQPLDVLRRVLDAFREGGGDGKPVYLQVHLCWDENQAAVE